MNGEDILPRELTNPVPRRGKWTAEEERYTEKIIFDFEHGTLDVPEGTTLRNLLSRVLNCDPMRITKKYTGNSSIGKRTFVPLVRTPENAIFMDMSQQDLRDLRASWISKLILMEQWNNRKMNLMKAHMGLGNMYDSVGGSSSAGIGLGMPSAASSLLHHRNLAATGTTIPATGTSNASHHLHDELASHTGDTNPSEHYYTPNSSTNPNHHQHNTNMNNISYTGIQFQEVSLRMILEPYVNTGSEMDYLIKWLKTLYYVLIDRIITIADIEHSLYVGSISLPALLAIYKSRCIEINPRLQQVHRIIERYLQQQLGMNLPVPLQPSVGGVHPSLSASQQQQLPLPLSMRALTSTSAIPDTTSNNKDISNNITERTEAEQATSREISPNPSSPREENVDPTNTTEESEQLEALRHQLGTGATVPLTTDGLLLTSSSMGSLKKLSSVPLPGLSATQVPPLSTRNNETTATSTSTNTTSSNSNMNTTTTTATTSTTTTTTGSGGVLSNSASTSTSSISVPDIDITVRHQSVFSHLPDHLKAYLTEAKKVNKAEGNSSNTTTDKQAINHPTITGTSSTSTTATAATTTTNIIPKSKETPVISLKPTSISGIYDKTPGAEARYYAELHAQAFAQQQARAIATAQAQAQALAESYRHPTNNTSSTSKERTSSRSTENLNPSSSTAEPPNGVAASTGSMNFSEVGNTQDSSSIAQYHRALVDSFSTATATGSVGIGTGAMKKAGIGGDAGVHPNNYLAGNNILPAAAILGRPPVPAGRGLKTASPISATTTAQAQKRRKLTEYTDMYMKAMYQQQQQQGMGGYHPPGYAAMYTPPPSYEQMQFAEHQMRLAAEHATSAPSGSSGTVGSITEQEASTSQDSNTTTIGASTTSLSSSPMGATAASVSTASAAGIPSLPKAAGRSLSAGSRGSDSTTVIAATDGSVPNKPSPSLGPEKQPAAAEQSSPTAITATGMNNTSTSNGSNSTTASTTASAPSASNARSSKATTNASPRSNYPSPYSPHFPGMGVAAGGIPAGMPPELYAYYMQQMYSGGWPYLAGTGMNSTGLPPHLLASMQQHSHGTGGSSYGNHPTGAHYMPQQMRGLHPAPGAAAKGQLSSGQGPAGFPSHPGSNSYHPGSNPASAAAADPNSAYHLHMIAALNNNNTQTHQQQRYLGAAAGTTGHHATQQHTSGQYNTMNDPALFAYMAQQQQLAAGRAGFVPSDMLNYSSLMNPSMPLHSNYNDYYASSYNRNNGITHSSGINNRGGGGMGEGEDPEAAVGHSAAAEALMRLLNN